MKKQSRASLKDAELWLEKGLIKGKDAEWVKDQLPSNLRTVKKRPKYNNQKVEYDGKVFDSKKEYKRYRELLIMLKAGKIGFLNLQESYLLLDKNESNRATTYKADFTYIDSTTGVKVVEDVKSDITRRNSTYILKKKLMKTVHNIDIKEV